MRRSIIVLGLISVLMTGSLWAQVDFNNITNSRLESDSTVVWTQIGPGNSGFANFLRFHPTIPGRVMLCPDMRNFYQSDNNGTSWFNIKDFDGEGDMTHIRDAYYAPSKPNVAIAMEGSQIFYSEDTAKTWTIVKNCPWYYLDTDGTDKQGWKGKMASLAIDPNDENTWYAGGGRNTAGQEWISCYNTATAANPRGSTDDYQGKLWKTTNAGATWQSITTGLDSRVQIGKIIVNPSNSNQVFASSQYGVYRSENGGQNWTQITEGKLQNNIIMNMDYYYNASSNTFVLYLIDQIQPVPNGSTTKFTGGIYRSSDAGETWTDITGDLYLDLNRISGGASTTYYSYLAKWFGKTVTEVKNLYPTLPTRALQNFYMLAVDPSREGALYIGFPDAQGGNRTFVPGRIWTTNNDGQKWINCARMYGEVWANDWAYWIERGNPYDENMVVGHQSPASQWGSNYAQRSVRAIAVGVDGSVMMIADHSTMLSTDHGESWHQVDEDYTVNGNIMGRGDSNLPGETMCFDKRHKYPFLGSGEHHFWIPTDDGTNGRQAVKYVPSTQSTISAIAVDPYDKNTVYTTSNREANKEYIFRSTDGGNNWQNYGRATPVSSSVWGQDMRTKGLIVNPIDNSHIYFGVTDISKPAQFDNQGTFYKSTNKGISFSIYNNGLPSNARIKDIEFDPRDNTRKSLFAAAEFSDFYEPKANGGLYFTSDEGANWTKVSTPASVQGVTEICIDNSNRMYIATGHRASGSGVWYSDDFGQNWTQIFTEARANYIDVSPFNRNLIAVVVGELAKNPGFYISFDRGETWHKSNRDIAVPHYIREINFDQHDPKKIWMADLGAGFYIGKIKSDDMIQKLDITIDALEYNSGANRQLDVNILDGGIEKQSLIWNSDNTAVVEVDQNGYLTAKSKGTAIIWVTTSDGIYSDYCKIIIKDTPTSVQGAVMKNESIYLAPNPSKDYVKIFNASETGPKVSFYNVAGGLVLQQTEKTRINVSMLEKGMYMVRIEDGKDIFIQKLIIE